MILEARELSKTYGAGETRVEALRDVNLQISGGEIVAIMGPSGSGKSTLLQFVGWGGHAEQRPGAAGRGRFSHARR